MASGQDIIVIGAGVVGCAVAYELARRGASVQVVDDRAAGMGATQAAAGILAPYVEADAEGPLLDLTVCSLHLFDEFMDRVARDGGVAVPYQRNGTLQVATTAAQLEAHTETAARLHRRGVAATVLDAEAVRMEEPHVRGQVAGGLIVPTHGFVGAGELTRALAAAARRHGAQVVEHSRVRRISVSGPDLIVETGRGSLGGSAVVLAAGSWSPQIEIEGVDARVPVRPVRGQLLRLEWQGPPLRRVTWSDRCYLVPWIDGTLLVGATVEHVGFDERTTVDGIRGLMDAACDLVPEIRGAGFAGARAGLRPGTIDDLPIIGPSRVIPRLMYATGHYRNGVLLAPLTAKLVADAMLDERMDPLLAAISPQRFGTL
jgi:glycine oxidase